MASWRWWFERMYRRGSPPWDSGVTPPELVELVSAMEPGRALDVGCGTGTNVAYLAERGWDAVGVDFSPTAIAIARAKTDGLERAEVMLGDVTRLGDLPITGGFDLIYDIGCYHSLPGARRDAYAAGVASLAGDGCELIFFTFARRLPWRLLGLGVTPREMRGRFAPWFEPVGRIPATMPPGAAYYRLRRR